MKKVLAGVAFLGILALAGLGVASWILVPRPTVYVVVKGDTLFEIGEAHSVSVAQIKEWNSLDSDTIEIGQELVIWTGGTAAAPVPARLPSKPRPSTTKPRPAPGARTLPREQPCLPPPTGDTLGEEGMTGSQGLSQGQIRDAMNAFVGEVLPCVSAAGASPSSTLELQITVACTGRVSAVHVTSGGDWPPDVADCVVDTLRYAPFPAHDLPDGETFGYPLRFSP